MFIDTPLSSVKIDICYLDNTYFNKKFLNIPTRQEALKEIVKLISYKREQIDNVIFQINLRILGKENLLEDLYEHFKIPILVSKQRYERIVGILKMKKEYFTTEYNEDTLIFVNDLNDEMPNFGENKNIIFIEPSALQISYTNRENKSFEDLYSDPNEKYFAIPYTDHSSYNEIIQFVKKLQPKLIIPIVRKALPGDLVTSDLTELNKFLSKEHLVDCHDKYRLLLRNTASVRRSSRLNMIQIPVKKTTNARKIVNSILNSRKTKVIKQIEYESDGSQGLSQEKTLGHIEEKIPLSVINEETDNKAEKNVVTIRRSTRLSGNSIHKESGQSQSDTVWTKLNDQVDIMEVETNSATENTETDSNDTQNDAEPISQSSKKDANLNVKKTTSTNTVITSEEDFATPLSSPSKKESEDLITSDCSSDAESIEVDSTLQNDMKNENQHEKDGNKINKHAESVQENIRSNDDIQSAEKMKTIIINQKQDVEPAQKPENQEHKNIQNTIETVQPTLTSNKENDQNLQNNIKSVQKIKSTLSNQTNKISFEAFYQRKTTKEENLSFYNFMNERLDKAGVMVDEKTLNENIMDCIFNSFNY